MSVETKHSIRCNFRLASLGKARRTDVADTIRSNFEHTAFRNKSSTLLKTSTTYTQSSMQTFYFEN